MKELPIIHPKSPKMMAFKRAIAAESTTDKSPVIKAWIMRCRMEVERR